MGILIAAVVLLTALTLFNLLLTMALVRRLRQLESSPGGGPSVPSPDLEDVPAGTPVPEFTAQSTDGVTVSSADRLGGMALYAFFDTACGSCKEQLQPLVDFARQVGLSREQVIAFVGDPRGEARTYTSVLEGHVTVVMQKVHDDVGQAFSLTGIPAFVFADARGVVVRSAVAVKDLEDALVGA
ncbi:TlpA family protein disulfide reductase [Nocardiopsis sp. NPDC050513]|uniref:TlpA family protein disulfide reductase n=1 Tax=Nocardiopsis sp. NPDC050513 TaxID=3364338 RepID=UPI0037AF51F8